MENPVQAMCQIDINIWMILEPGYLVAINFLTLETVCQTKVPELENEEVASMATVDNQAGLFVIVCKSGLLVFVTSHLKVEKMNFNILSLITAKDGNEKENDVKLSMLSIVSSQLNTVEVCKSQISDHMHIELWCGCENGVIEIFLPCNADYKPQLKTVLKTHSSSKDIPQNASIIKLKSSVNGHIYALHSCGSVISSWSASYEHPILNAIIKLTQLDSPGS